MEDRRQTRGKQKIEMKRIDKEDDRITTFSKRRSGIYKKATEIATLCGAEVGFGTFSPSGKPFSFAQPSMDSIESRFNNIIQDQSPPLLFNLNAGDSDDHPYVRAHRQAKLEALIQRYNELAGSLEAEKETRKAIEKLVEDKAVAVLRDKAPMGTGWWETPVDDLGYEELLRMNESLEYLHKKLCHHINGERATPAFDAMASAQGISNLFITEDPNDLRIRNSGKNPN